MTQERGREESVKGWAEEEARVADLERIVRSFYEAAVKNHDETPAGCDSRKGYAEDVADLSRALTIVRDLPSLLLSAERRGIERAERALNQRRPYTVATECPDSRPGCLVLHFRTEERVPRTREECLEAIRSLPPGGGA